MNKASNYAAFAAKADGGWVARYGAPGDVIRSISDESGQDFIYESEGDAADAAAVRLVEILQTRFDAVRRGRKSNKRTISGKELVDLIDQAGIPITEFVQLTGIRGDQMIKMIAGEQKVSPAVASMARLLAHSPEALDAARTLGKEDS